MPIKTEIYQSQRIWPDYKIGQPALSDCTFEDLCRTGLAAELQNGAANILYETDKYVIFSRTKTGIHSSYDCLVNVFPRRGNKPVQLAGELPLLERKKLWQILEKAPSAINKVAEQHGATLPKVYVQQHLSDDPSYRQAHFHIYGFDEEEISSDLYTVKQDSKTYRFTYEDPTIILAYDLLRRCMPDVPCTIDKNTSSIIVASGHTFKIDEGVDNLMNSLISKWKDWKNEMQQCFIPDIQQPDNVYDPHQRVTNIHNFAAKYELSSRSILLLKYLSSHLTTRENSEYEFAPGLYGSWGCEVDTTDGHYNLRWAPRSFCTSERSGATGYRRIVVKDRSRYYSPHIQSWLIYIQKQMQQELVAACEGIQ